MKAYIFGEQEKNDTGFTHKYVIPYTDMTSTAGTGLTVTLDTYTAGTQFKDAAHKVVTAFDGGATSELTLKVGYDGATTDNDDGLIEAVSIHVDATEVLYGGANGADFATKLNGYTALDAGILTATFTATGANLTALTTGEVHIYVKRVDLTKY